MLNIALAHSTNLMHMRSVACPCSTTGLEEEQEHGIVDAMFEKSVLADEVIIRSAAELLPAEMC